MLANNDINNQRLQRKDEPSKHNSNPNKSHTSGTDGDNSHPDERMSDTNSIREEKSRCIRTQKSCSNDASSMVQKEAAGKHNKNLNTVLISKRNVESNCQAAESYEGRSDSSINSTLKEETHKGTRISGSDSNFLEDSQHITDPSMRQKKVSRMLHNNTKEYPALGREVANSSQKARISGSSFTHMEEFCHTERQTVYNSSSMLPERKFGKSRKDTEKTFKSKRDIESYCQENNNVGSGSGKSSILVEESYHVKIQTSDSSDIPSVQKREKDRNTKTTTDLASKDNGVGSHLGKRISGSESILEEEFSRVDSPSIKQKKASGSHINSSNLTSGKEVIISYQGVKVSGPISTLKEESYHGKESDEPKKEMNTVLISDRGIESNHQIEQMVDKDSILMEEYRQVEMLKTCSRSSKHPERETSRQEKNPHQEEMMKSAIKRFQA